MCVHVALIMHMHSKTRDRSRHESFRLIIRRVKCADMHVLICTVPRSLQYLRFSGIAMSKPTGTRKGKKNELRIQYILSAAFCCNSYTSAAPWESAVTLAAGISRGDRSHAWRRSNQRQEGFLFFSAQASTSELRLRVPRPLDWRVTGAGCPQRAAGLHTTGDRGLVWVWAWKNFRSSLDVSASKPATLLLLHTL